MYSTLEDAFEAMSKRTGKVSFSRFKAFIEENDALRGYNLSD